MTETNKGAYCGTARAIVPMHDKICDWCGHGHTAQFTWQWVESESRSKWVNS